MYYYFKHKKANMRITSYINIPKIVFLYSQKWISYNSVMSIVHERHPNYILYYNNGIFVIFKHLLLHN